MSKALKILGVIMLVVGVILISPLLSSTPPLALGGAPGSLSIYWYYPSGTANYPSQLQCDANNEPWLELAVMDPTNYTLTWVNGVVSFPFNGTLTITGPASYSQTLTLQTSNTNLQPIQGGFIYSFGAQGWVDIATNPWHTGDPIPAGWAVEAAWWNPTVMLLYKQDAPFLLMSEGPAYTFTWNINTPEGPFTAVGYGKKYFNIQGTWSADNHKLTPLAYTVSSPNLLLQFTPSVGAASISSVYVSVFRRGEASAKMLNLTKTADGSAYTLSLTLWASGVYDLHCYISDASGVGDVESLYTILNYGMGGGGWTMLNWTGVGFFGVGIAAIVVPTKRRRS